MEKHPVHHVSDFTLLNDVFFQRLIFHIICLIFVAIGISNQRETTVVWDRVTGLPLYNAIGLYIICFSIVLLHFIKLVYKYLLLLIS